MTTSKHLCRRVSNAMGDAFADRFSSKADAFSEGSSSQLRGAQGVVLTLHRSACVECHVLTRPSREVPAMLIPGLQQPVPGGLRERLWNPQMTDLVTYTPHCLSVPGSDEKAQLSNFTEAPREDMLSPGARGRGCSGISTPHGG